MLSWRRKYTEGHVEAQRVQQTMHMGVETFHMGVDGRNDNREYSNDKVVRDRNTVQASRRCREHTGRVSCVVSYTVRTVPKRDSLMMQDT